MKHEGNELRGVVGEFHRPSWITLTKDPILFLATGGGVGFAAKGPGTLGALLGLGLTAMLHHWASPSVSLAIVVGLLLAGIWICELAARRLGKKDPSQVIWDEITTVPLVFLGANAPGSSLAIWLLGFILHRFFDITKIAPASWCERWPGGWGIMADDCVAAGYAWGCLWLIRSQFGEYLG